MKKITNILLITAVFLIASKCFKKPEPTDPIEQLPPATQEGKNTFGCLVNGEVYLPKGSFNTPATSLSYGGGGVLISSNNVRTDESIGLNIKGIKLEPQFIELRFRKEPLIWALYNNKSKLSIYVIDSINYTGELIITRFDTVENIVSGTFWFDAVNENDSTDVVQIREGRFDLR